MHPKPWIGLAEAERGSRAQGWSAKPCPSHAAAGSPRLHRAPRGAEGAEPGTRRACVVCVPRAAAAATAAAAAAATSAFGSRIRNPCAQLTMKQSSNVPAFLSKLWTLVEETHTNEFITWSQVQSGTPWPRVSLVEPARLDSARLGSAGLGWAGLGSAAPAACGGARPPHLARTPGFVCTASRPRRLRSPPAARRGGGEPC